MPEDGILGSDMLRGVDPDLLKGRLVNPDILNRGPYAMSAWLRAQVDWYGFNAEDIEIAINYLGGLARKPAATPRDESLVDDSMHIVRPDYVLLADPVSVFDGKTVKKLRPKPALDLLKRMLAKPGSRTALYDEADFIMCADGVGLMTGTLWLMFPCADQACSHTAPRLTTINLEPEPS
jgi:hypothetical protein